MSFDFLPQPQQLKPANRSSSQWLTIGITGLGLLLVVIVSFTPHISKAAQPAEAVDPTFQSEVGANGFIRLKVES